MVKLVNGLTIEILVVIKRYLIVVKLEMGLYYKYLKVVVFLIKLHHRV